MTDRQWAVIETALRQIESQFQRIERTTNGLMIAPDSPLIDPFYRVADLLIAALSASVGDENETIEWYVYECDFGRSPRLARIGGKEILVDSLEKLRLAIDATCAENTEQAPAADTPRIYSVAERLPEEGQSVVIAARYPDLLGGVLRWYVSVYEHGSFWMLYGKDHVTHWFALPPLPECDNDLLPESEDDELRLGSAPEK